MLSKKTAQDIALLFNSIDVAEMLQRSADAKRLAGQISIAEFNESYERWKQHAVKAAKKLQAKYGIVPVGYTRDLGVEEAA